MLFGAELVGLAGGGLLAVSVASVWASKGGGDEGGYGDGHEQTSRNSERVDIIEDGGRDALNEEGQNSPTGFAGIDVIDDGEGGVYDEPEEEQKSYGEGRQDSGEAEGEQTTTSKTANGKAIGTAAATEIARRAGIDRHTEAGLAEDFHAEAYARKVGGSVVSDNTSAFTPDGGVDKIVMTPDGEKAIQSKHYASAVSDATLRHYDPDVDVIASTKGISEKADPSKYDLEVVTYDDWPISAKARLEARRIQRGVLKGLQHPAESASSIARRVAGGGKYALKQLLGGAKLAGKCLSSVAMRTGSKFAQYPITTQFVVAVVFVGGPLWLLWRKWRGRYTHRDLVKWLAVAGSVLAVFAVRNWWKSRR